MEKSATSDVWQAILGGAKMLIQTALRDCGAGWWLAAVVAIAVCLGEGSASAQEVVASINNENITQAEFYGRLQKVKGADFLVPTNPPGMRQETAGYILLNSMINERLILQLAAKEALTPTDDEVKADLDPLMNQDSIKKAIHDHLITADEVKYPLMVQTARYNLATTRQKVTAAEIEQFYNDHIESYKSPERWNLSAIRTTKIDDAIKVAKELKSGKTFEETARTYSEDERTRAIGGRIGLIDATDKSLPEEIRRAVRDLRVGQFTDPIAVKFDAGGANGVTQVYWIVKLTEKQEANQRQLAEVRHQLERLASLKKAGGLEVADKKILDFRKASIVKINLPGYDALLSAKQ